LPLCHITQEAIELVSNPNILASFLLSSGWDSFQGTLSRLT